jgi:hypothetical protein
MIKRHLLLTLFTVFFTILVTQLPTTSYAQDSIKKQKILVVEKENQKIRYIRNPKGTLTEIQPRSFKTGKKVIVKRYDNDTTLRGKIELITDSSLTIKGKSINLSKIKSICAYRGLEPTILGLSMISAGIISVLLFESFENDNYDGGDYNTSNLIGPFLSIAVAFLGACTTVFGIVETITIKNYKMDKYKLRIKTIE